MIIPVHPINPQRRVLEETAAELMRGGIYILPTDTVYAFAAAMDQKKAIERIYFIKKMSEHKVISVFCHDISAASKYICMDNNSIFRWMKSHLPGPYTLVFKASKNLPNYAVTKQKTVGIRIVTNPVINGLLEIMKVPIVGTSAYNSEESLTYPEDLERLYGKQLTGILDTGPVENIFSTVIDLSNRHPNVIRQGIGETFDLPE
ncbi:MAG: L-threonylcarbamoyladenylate synthase [Spirochaetia bacterium]|nr:L-threonylcarbamoyladenylate synthase [Spirochaetia bacterium]